MSKISDRLKELRAEKNLSQNKLSELLGITRTTYANYEQGTREPSIEMIVKFCDFFDVSADYLIGRSDC